ncbi:MAG TPA: winged helix DNA-binding domain-containing protein [Thermoleophilaceae bacterium]|nr:winged helix DNA-binding domain-containing protein [Thermoleophilaceae bacterium]
MPDRVLDDRALNRALLARQGLLARRQATPLEMIDRLVGMQGEEPSFPYVALWSRIRDFDPAALEGVLTGREAVRLWVMRGTIHLTTVADAVSMYPFTRRLHGQSFRSAFTAGLAGADPADVTAAAVELISAQPRTKGEIADALQERWPDAERQSLSYCVTHHAPCVQVPPRGLFRQPGPVRLAPLEQWVGRQLDPDPSLTDLVWRYLAAFGPATVADMRIWSRITGLREAFEELRPRLLTYRDKEGRELFDVPDGPLPDPDTPAPPRFLPRLENALLGFDDRSRVFDGHGPGPQARKGRLAGVVLVDGFHRANWLLSEDKGTATLFVDGLEGAPDEVEAEARAFLDFWAAGADRRELVL